MKAYVVGLESNPDAGNEIVFANNSKEAKKKAMCTQIAEERESYIDVTVHRDLTFDGMENKPEVEIAAKKWEEGWWWLDKTDVPSIEAATHQEFIDWFNENF